MPWWNRKIAVPPSSSSSSPSPSPSPSSVASSPGGRSRYSNLRLPWSRRGDAQRRASRHHEFRRLSDIEDDGLSFDSGAAASGGGDRLSVSSTPVSRSPSNSNCNPGRTSSSPALLPHPLPLPEFVAAATATAPASPRRESTSAPALGFGFPSPNCARCPLPSPREASSRSEGYEGCHAAAESSSIGEPLNKRASSAGVEGSRLPHQTSHRRPEHSGISLNGFTFRRRRKIYQDPNSAGTVTYGLNMPAKSAPTSQFSSPVCSPLCSPRRLSNADFSTFGMATPGIETWSAPELPPVDVVSLFSSQTTSEQVIGSPDCSPLCSPTSRSPILRSRNPSAPSSPLHTKALSDNSVLWHENGSNVNVHPLPLPPGAASSSQSGFSHQSAAKAEALPMRSQWKKGKLIGSGTFGNVYEATNRHTGALCAMKEVNIIPDDVKSAECIRQLEQEIKFLSQFKHPNIVQYYGSETIDDQLYIYLEYVHPGSINKYVRQHCGAMTESVVRNFTRHILKGLAYLHSKNIMHRDIKGANLLVNVHGIVKLADFGMAKHLSGTMGALSLKGSPYWMAPEVVQATMNKDVGYDFAVDIWSLGCTIIEMFTGKQPWNGLEGAAAMFKVLHKDPPIPESLSNDGKDFLRCCFHRNPTDRPAANMLLEHPFIKNSHHYNAHGSLQAFAGIKIFDNSIIPREKSKSKSEPCVKERHTVTGKNRNSRPGTSKTAASRVSPCSTPAIVPSSSPPHSSYIMMSLAGSSTNILNGRTSLRSPRN
ncbi:mitogen-activated protein kinase kinase kinase 5 isoform X1 [Musa acuminata AAA Group]|uniref:mitogen-activated protein kinase kinase kinase 5 isoform X1 n=1 Tax=Musa acuminata AAA Group TaxID=214697 RepID=UPI0031DBF3B5